jgi:MFS family permease
MLISLFVGPPLMLGLGMATSMVAIVCLAPLVGAAYELYRPAVGAIVADLVSPVDRPRAYGLLYWAVNLGAAVAPVLAGFMARRSYLWLFVADAATTFLYGLIVWARVQETRPAVAPEGHRRGLAPVLADRLFMAFCGLSFVMAILFHQGWTSLSLYLAREGFSTSTYGSIVAVNGLLIILVQPFTGRMLARFDRGRVLVVAALLTGAGMVANALVRQAWQYGVAVAVWTLGEIASVPLTSAIAADLAPPDLRGRYQGVNWASWAVAGAVAPTLGAVVLGAGGVALWWWCGGVAAALAVAYRSFGRALREAAPARPMGTGVGGGAGAPARL